MDSPLSRDYPDDADRDLVTQAQAGDRQALEELVTRHQPWIYNIAVRMLYSAENAEDATQDILIRMMTGLRTFRWESKFRTWLYRLATNHILNFKKKWAAAEPVYTFEWFASDLDATGLSDVPDPRTVPVPVEVLIVEAKMSCTAAMLLCLDGRQRLVYTLGEIFGVSDSVGAEVAGITPDKLQFAASHRRRVRDVAPSRGDELLDASHRLYAALYREHPFVEPPSELVRKALASVSLDSPN